MKFHPVCPVCEKEIEADLADRDLPDDKEAAERIKRGYGTHEACAEKTERPE